jgi:hypothetical protein
MKTILTLTLALPGLLFATPRPKADALPGSDGGAAKAAIRIIIEDDGNPVTIPTINKGRSAAADPAGRYLSLFSIAKNGEETALPKPASVQCPDFDEDGWVPMITIFLPVDADPDVEYRVVLRSGGGDPAISFKSGDGLNTLAGPLEFKAKFLKEDLPEASKPLAPSLSIGGGSDSALLSLRWSAGGKIARDGEFGRWFANVEADLSPTEAAAESLITGHVEGNLEGLWRLIDTRDQPVDITTYVGIAANFDSNQDFDDWDAKLGLSSWWFIQGKPIQKFGSLLRLSGDDYPSHPLAIKLFANYVAAHERSTGIAEPEDFQVSARLMWLNRIFTSARLPFMEAAFDVNLLVDIGTTLEPDRSQLHPETKLSLEFEPQAYKDSNLAFALTWAHGEFSPTFVDEDALLAGIKLRF